MPLTIRIESDGDIKTILDLDQGLPGISRRWGQADQAIQIGCYKKKRWLNTGLIANKLLNQIVAKTSWTSMGMGQR